MRDIFKWVNLRGTTRMYAAHFPQNAKTPIALAATVGIIKIL